MIIRQFKIIDRICSKYSLWVLHPYSCFLLVIIAFVFLFSSIHTSGVFNLVFVDYKVWYSVGKTLRSHGFEFLYDLQLLESYQSIVGEYSRYVPTRMETKEHLKVVLPYVYPPIFSYIFYFVGTINPVTESIAICLLMLFLLIFSLYSLCENTDRKSDKLSMSFILLTSIVSTGAYFSYFFLNPSILLAVFAAFGLMFLTENKNLLAGFFFSLLFIKPNIGIWILFGLFCSTRIAIILWVILFISIYFISSLYLVGSLGIAKWIDILINYKEEYGNWPKSMPNIRLFYELFFELFGQNISAILTTAIVIFLSFLGFNSIKNYKDDYISIMFIISILSLLLNFHSHLHTYSILIPFAILSYFNNKISLVEFHSLLFLPLFTFFTLEILFLDTKLSFFSTSLLSIMICVYFLTKYSSIVLFSDSKRQKPPQKN